MRHRTTGTTSPTKAFALLAVSAAGALLAAAGVLVARGAHLADAAGLLVGAVAVLGYLGVRALRTESDMFDGSEISTLVFPPESNLETRRGAGRGR